MSARRTNVVTLSRQWVVDYGKHPLVGEDYTSKRFELAGVRVGYQVTRSSFGGVFDLIEMVGIVMSP